MVVADLRGADAAQRLAATAQARLGGVDILVNTVGPFPRDAAVKNTFYASDASWAAVFDTVFMTAVRICREIIPQMKAAGRGSVINLAANSARATTIRAPPEYGPMKAALTDITLKNWARDAIKRGVRVNAILPGWVRTSAMERALAEQAQRQDRSAADVEREMVAAHDALFWSGRMGAPREYADLISFLASDRASYDAARHKARPRSDTPNSRRNTAGRPGAT